MKGIIVSYTVMLLMCVFIGVIVALICCYSLWWAFLFLCPIVWSYIPLATLRDKIPKYSDFSTLLFMIAFAIWCVVAMAITMRFNVESFISVVCVISVWAALLMTARLISMVQDSSRKR